jgi:phage I-like protein
MMPMKNMNHLPILNRAATLPDDGWYHVCPIGEFSVRDSGNRKIIQVCDQRAMKAMVDRLIAEGGPLLVDYDHFSYDTTKPSEAAGWLTQLEAREDGLWAKIEWTDMGAAAVLNKRYRFVSPVWYPDECEPVANKSDAIRPLRLDSIAITNSPNLKGMRPLSNRGTGIEPMKHRAGDDQMNELKTLLGLAEAATDADVVAAVKAMKTGAAEAAALKNRVETAETALAAVKQAQLEADADAFCEQHKDVILNRDQVRSQFIANRPGTEALFAGLKKAGGDDGTRRPLNNRQKPGSAESATEPTAAETARAAAIRNRAHTIMTERKVSFPVAFDAAAAEL